MKPLAGLSAALLLAACASDKAPPAAKSDKPTATAAASATASAAPASAAASASAPASAPVSARAGNDKKLTEAVVAPLADLNIVRTPIPLILATAQKAPYAFPADTSCAGLGAEIAELDAELDPDMDIVNAADPTLMEKGTREATDAVIGAVRSTTEGVIPFRGWVRKLTGADRYAKEVSAALMAGTIRRAYLKGLGKAAGCTPPAAPKNEKPRPEPVKAEKSSAK